MLTNMKKEVLKYMSNLDIIENQLTIGDVKVITCNGGKNIRFIELLFFTPQKFNLRQLKQKEYSVIRDDNKLTIART